MTTETTATPPGRTIPEGYGTVTPWGIGKDTAGLLAFLKEAFDAEELYRLADEHGRIRHAEIRIGDSIVMMFDRPVGWPATPAFLRLYVPDGKATFERALAAGATPVTRMTHLFFGDLVGRVQDPFGNVLWIHQRIEEVDADEAARRMQAPEWMERMVYVAGSLVELPRA